MKKKSRKQSPTLNQSSTLDRRTFVKALPALGMGAIAASHADAPSALAEQAQAQAQAQQVSKEALHSAEALIGVELTDAEEAMALPGVNRNRASYDALRKVEVPLDTEPAIAFHPAPPGKKLGARAAKLRATKLRATKFQISKQEIPAYKSVEDVAFFTATQLAELIRTRRLSPVELTKMYVARLKRYGPRLNCVVTLTEDLALKQAQQAESEIKRGKYRGPLHGIPWGAKDLFATKGIPTTWGPSHIATRESVMV